MSRVLKTIGCCCIVGMFCASASAQDTAQYFWVPQGEDPAGNSSGPRTINVAPGSTQVCLEMFIQASSGADFQSLGGGNAFDANAAFSGGGTLQSDCVKTFGAASIAPATLYFDTAFTTPFTNAGNPFDLAAFTLNSIDVSGCGPAVGDNIRSLRGGFGPATIPASGGAYWMTACYDISAGACGDATITFTGTDIGDAGGGALVATGSSVTISIGQPNDVCSAATGIGNATTAFDTTCATQDGDAAHASCSLNTGNDVWFLYTADCTGDFNVAGAGAATIAVYNPNTGCTPTDADVAGCGTGAVGPIVVSNGDTVLIQIGSTDGSAVLGDITTSCAAFCDPSQPADSAVTISECGDTGDPCTLAWCNPATGCEVVSTDPNDAANTTDGLLCDDGLFCQVNDACAAGVCVGADPKNCDDGAPCTADACDEAGATCTNTDINTLTCAVDADCPAAASGCVGGFCECIANPPLCLNASNTTPGAASGTCGFTEGGQIQVTVDMDFSTTPICAAQFFLEYDTGCMELVSIAPGGGVFNTVLFEFADTTNGTIDYVVGAPPGQICSGTQLGTVAVLTFNATCSCKTQGVRFRAHNPPTRLGGADGTEVCPLGHVNEAGLCNEINNGVFSPCNTGKLTIDSSAPVINCPVFKTGGNADCGVVTRNVTWAPLVAVDNCDGAVPVTCSITHNRGANVQSLLSTGGDFPPGLTTVDCGSVQDTCGNKSGCVFSVFNSGQNLISVDVELSPTMDAGPITRGIELTVSDCGSIVNGSAITACDDVEFGFPFNIPGHGVANAKVPPGNYACVEARDPLHTLSSTCAVMCGVLADGGTGWVASFKGSKDLSSTCHWLVNGNLNGDPNIDILDYVTYLNQVANNAMPGSDTTCADAGPHADINGDGIVNLQDFSFILINIFNNDKAGCDAVCAPAAVAPGNGPIDSISLRDLSAMGLGRAGRLADIDRNGTVDVTDMALYLENGGTANTTKTVRDARRTTRGTRSVRGLR